MVIAVENGLDMLKKYLTERGFFVVDLGSTCIYDAAVYQDMSIFNIPASEALSVKSGFGQVGTLLVCAKGKTPREVENMLIQKAYCNLF